MINLGLSVNMVHCWAAELPLEFPDGTTPVMSRVCIYDSAVGGGVGVGAPLKIALPPQLPLGSLYMEEVHAKVCPYWPLWNPAYFLLVIQEKLIVNILLE